VVDATFAIFIDYDNLEQTQKIGGILDVVTKVLFQIPINIATTRAKCEVRVYGGWYEYAQITRLAQEVTIEMQRDFPKVIRLPASDGGHISVVANAELAVALLQEPSHHMFNTYRRKGKPRNVRVESPNVAGCTDSDCVLPMMKKLLRTGICPKHGCSITDDNLVYRHEQKLVDTMLSCDIIYSANFNLEKVILVSGDDDFLPPLRSILLGGVAAIRFHPKPNGQRASFPSGGAQLIEKDL
jgi:uncharacterized LabA/DUF88 family protein